MCQLMRSPEEPTLEPSSVDTPPLLVGEEQSDDATDTRAPGGSNSRRAPVSIVVRTTLAPRIVHESEGDRAANRAAGRILDCAGERIDALADIEADDRCARNCQRTSGAIDVQAENAAVRGFDSAAHELATLRSLLLTTGFRQPHTHARAGSNFIR